MTTERFNSEQQIYDNCFLQQNLCKPDTKDWSYEIFKDLLHKGVKPEYIFDIISGDLFQLLFQTVVHSSSDKLSSSDIFNFIIKSHLKYPVEVEEYLINSISTEKDFILLHFPWIQKVVSVLAVDKLLEVYFKSSELIKKEEKKSRDLLDISRQYIIWHTDDNPMFEPEMFFRNPPGTVNYIVKLEMVDILLEPAILEVVLQLSGSITFNYNLINFSAAYSVALSDVFQNRTVKEKYRAPVSIIASLVILQEILNNPMILQDVDKFTGLELLLPFYGNSPLLSDYVKVLKRNDEKFQEVLSVALGLRRTNREIVNMVFSFMKKFPENSIKALQKASSNISLSALIDNFGSLDVVEEYFDFEKLPPVLKLNFLSRFRKPEFCDELKEYADKVDVFDLIYYFLLEESTEIQNLLIDEIKKKDDSCEVRDVFLNWIEKPDKNNPVVKIRCLNCNCVSDVVIEKAAFSGIDKKSSSVAFVKSLNYCPRCDEILLGIMENMEVFNEYENMVFRESFLSLNQKKIKDLINEIRGKRFLKMNPHRLLDAVNILEQAENFLGASFLLEFWQMENNVYYFEFLEKNLTYGTDGNNIVNLTWDHCINSKYFFRFLSKQKNHREKTLENIFKMLSGKRFSETLMNEESLPLPEYVFREMGIMAAQRSPNDLCFCGSGKKYKKCCQRKGQFCV
ncbi:MAG: SEC-C domain-containing protein [Deltaproteobacteria bacterium]|nr:SEC-C domain-containing protein [Deltaproteobacteria bacterium]